MVDKIHVVGFSGSLRKNSYNKSLLKTAGELMPEDMELEILDLTPLPFYNQDLESGPLPEAVKHFRERVAAADGVIIATPEFNYSTTAALKNALEWLSRPLPDLPISGKPVALMGAGGIMGTSRAQYHLRQMGVGMNMLIMGKPEVMVPNASTKFDAQGNLIDETTRNFVRDEMVAFEKWIRRLNPELVKS